MAYYAISQLGTINMVSRALRFSGLLGMTFGVGAGSCLTTFGGGLSTRQKRQQEILFSVWLRNSFFWLADGSLYKYLYKILKYFNLHTVFIYFLSSEN